MKFCVDCAMCTQDMGKYRCLATGSISLVTGKRVGMSECVYVRTETGYCGPDARYFKAKEIPDA